MHFIYVDGAIYIVPLVLLLKMAQAVEISGILFRKIRNVAMEICVMRNMDVDVFNMDSADRCCLVTTRTHINYKLLVLYRICERVYADQR